MDGWSLAAVASAEFASGADELSVARCAPSVGQQERVFKPDPGVDASRHRVYDQAPRGVSVAMLKARNGRIVPVEHVVDGADQRHSVIGAHVYWLDHHPGNPASQAGAYEQLSVRDGPDTSLDPDASPKQRLHHLQGAVF